MTQMKDLYLHLVNIRAVCVQKKQKAYCIFYKNCVHKRCSNFKGRLIDKPDFKYYSCQHLTESEKEAHKFKLGNFDYERVDKVCFLGDMLSGAGGEKASSITRIRTGWKKFRELLPFLISKVFSHKMKGNIFKVCVSSSMLYGSQTLPVKIEDTCTLHWTEMLMDNECEESVV